MESYKQNDRNFIVENFPCIDGFFMTVFENLQISEPLLVAYKIMYLLSSFIQEWVGR